MIFTHDNFVIFRGLQNENFDMSEDLISSLYPPPPVFYKYFTEENLKKYEQAKDSDTPIEGELKLFSPPEKPSGTHYRGYGNIWSFEDKLPKLSEMGHTQLYQDNEENRIPELHKLMKSLLVNFIELLGIMSITPSEFHTKIEDLKVLLININHILNSYRPHQSRELLIMLLKQRINDKRDEITKMDDKMQDIKLQLQSLVKFDDIKLSTKSPVENGKSDAEIREELLNKLLIDI